MTPQDILSVGIATSVGFRPGAVAAAVRGAIDGFAEQALLDKRLRPRVMAVLPDEDLPPLAPALEDVLMTGANARMLQLAGVALADAAAPCPGQPLPLFLAVHELRSDVPDLVHPELLRQLEAQSGVALDDRASRLFRQGGAGGLCALGAAMEWLGAGRGECALVGGVDSFHDLKRLGVLDAEDRLHGSSKDGFIPGEGAAFLLLGSRTLRSRLGLPPIARVTGVGLGAERGHRYSAEPYRGEGLVQAFRALFQGLPPGTPPVRCVYAGFNGESLPAKEWGVARIRTAARFAEDAAIEHPADCVGDMGAALGPLMVALAAVGIQGGYRDAPCLVWSTSDREARAAAMLEAAIA